MGESVTAPERKPSETGKAPEGKPSGTSKPAPAAPMERAFVPILLCIVAGIIVGYAAYALFLAAPQPQVQSQPNFNVTPIAVPPVNKTPAFSITLINDTRCKNCNAAESLMLQLEQVASQFNMSVAKITVLDAGLPEAQALISQYSIKRLPALVLSNESSSSASFTSIWTANLGTKESDGALVYRGAIPPYYDLQNNTVVGIVDVVEIRASNCPDCVNVSRMTQSLAGPQVGMVIGNSSVYGSDSPEAKALIAKYNITKVPTLLLSPDAGAYSPIAGAWSSYGTVEQDGWYVYRNIYPPYADFTSGSIVGRVSLIELADPSCTECYNVSLHYEGLKQQIGMVFANRTTYAINSTQGKALLKKYNITAVPAIVLSSDALSYAGFGTYWEQVGTVESDGWLVMRSVESFGTFRNLTSGNITIGTPPAQNGSTATGG